MAILHKREKIVEPIIATLKANYKMYSDHYLDLLSICFAFSLDEGIKKITKKFVLCFIITWTDIFTTQTVLDNHLVVDFYESFASIFEKNQNSVFNVANYFTNKKFDFILEHSNAFFVAFKFAMESFQPNEKHLTPSAFTTVCFLHYLNLYSFVQGESIPETSMQKKLVPPNYPLDDLKHAHVVFVCFLLLVF